MSLSRSIHEYVGTYVLGVGAVAGVCCCGWTSRPCRTADEAALMVDDHVRKAAT